MQHAARYGYSDTTLGQLHYREQGDGPVVLLLHQTPRSLDEFRELLPLLARSHRAIAMDMPGFGNSVSLPSPQTIEQYAAGALALLDALDIPRAAVLGHHTGGAVAVEVAAAAPERVSHLVLSSTPWVDAASRVARAEGPHVDEVERRADGGHLVELWEGRAPYYPEDSTVPLLDRFVRDALAPGIDPAEGHRAVARYTMEERVGKVTAPVLLLCGEADPFAMPSLPRLSAALTSAAEVSEVVIPGGTIPLMEQCAEEVSAAVLSFLGRGRPSCTRP